MSKRFIPEPSTAGTAAVQQWPVTRERVERLTPAGVRKGGSSLRREGEPVVFWRGSTYTEPTWVSLAWIIGPLSIAVLGIYFALS